MLLCTLRLRVQDDMVIRTMHIYLHMQPMT